MSYLQKPMRVFNDSDIWVFSWQKKTRLNYSGGEGGDDLNLPGQNKINFYLCQTDLVIEKTRVSRKQISALHKCIYGRLTE